MYSYELPGTDRYYFHLAHAEPGHTDLVACSIYPSDAPTSLLPVKVLGDGNCLFRSASKLVFGNEGHHIEMRARCVVELLCESDYYLSGAPFHNAHADILQWIAAFTRPSEVSEPGVCRSPSLTQCNEQSLYTWRAISIISSSELSFGKGVPGVYGKE